MVKAFNRFNSYCEKHTVMYPIIILIYAFLAILSAFFGVILYVLVSLASFHIGLIITKNEYEKECKEIIQKAYIERSYYQIVLSKNNDESQYYHDRCKSLFFDNMKKLDELYELGMKSDDIYYNALQNTLFHYRNLAGTEHFSYLKWDGSVSVVFQNIIDVDYIPDDVEFVLIFTAKCVFLEIPVEMAKEWIFDVNQFWERAEIIQKTGSAGAVKHDEKTKVIITSDAKAPYIIVSTENIEKWNMEHQLDNNV